VRSSPDDRPVSDLHLSARRSVFGVVDGLLRLELVLHRGQVIGVHTRRDRAAADNPPHVGIIALDVVAEGVAPDAVEINVAPGRGYRVQRRIAEGAAIMARVVQVEALYIPAREEVVVAPEAQLVDEVLALAVIVHEQHVGFRAKDLAREPVQTVVILPVAGHIEDNDVDDEVADEVRGHSPHPAEHSVARHGIAVLRVAIVEQLDAGDNCLVVPLVELDPINGCIPLLRAGPGPTVGVVRVPNLDVGVLDVNEDALDARILIEHVHMEVDVAAGREQPRLGGILVTGGREGQAADHWWVDVLVDGRPDVPLGARGIGALRLVVQPHRLLRIGGKRRPTGIEVVGRVSDIVVGDWLGLDACRDFAHAIHAVDVVVVLRISVHQAIAGEREEGAVLAPGGVAVAGEAVAATVSDGLVIQRVGVHAMDAGRRTDCRGIGDRVAAQASGGRAVRHPCGSGVVRGRECDLSLRQVAGNRKREDVPVAVDIALVGDRVAVGAPGRVALVEARGLLIGQTLDHVGAAHLEDVDFPIAGLIPGIGDNVAAGAVRGLNLVAGPVGELNLLRTVRAHDPDIVVGDEGGVLGESRVDASICVFIHAVAAEDNAVGQDTGRAVRVALLRDLRSGREVGVGYRPRALGRAHAPGAWGQELPDILVVAHAPQSVVVRSRGATNRRERRGCGINGER